MLTFLRTLDPIFALSVGITAAVVRINREEKAKGKTTQDIFDALKRRTALVFPGGEKVQAVQGKTG